MGILEGITHICAISLGYKEDQSPIAELIFIASFPENETWRDLRLADYPWL